MTDKITGGTRLHRIARALASYGPMPLQGIRQHVHAPRYYDMHEMLALGYVVVTGKIAPASACGIKEMDVYKLTKAGTVFAAVEAKPKMRGPGKPKLNRVELVITKASKATVKLVPKEDVEITYTEQTKFTTYEPKYVVNTYIPPKNFMECIR
jgi:hypothetical protein